MNRIAVSLAVLLAAISVVACTFPATPAPEAKTPATAGPAAAPQTAPWANIVAEARKERTVTIYSVDWSAGTRMALSEAFRKQFGIDLEFTNFGRAAEEVARVQMERSAGLNLADVYTNGSPLITSMKPAGHLGNMEPLLVLPEVVDPKGWGGRFPWMDKDKTTVAMSAVMQRYISFNTDQVKKNEITSFRDLLKPQYKGKMALNDPSLGGGGASLFGFLAETWSLEESKSLLTALIKQQDVAMTRDGRLQVEWVARGKYAIALAAMSGPMNEFRKAGAPLENVVAQEGSRVSAAAGRIGVPVTPAHPNASRVFVNWLLSKEGQAIFARTYGYPSLRTDIPTDGIDPEVLPKQGEKLVLETEEAILFKPEMLNILIDVMQQAAK
ncbi:MAG: extracellular solute-binding protein [Chloroflexi bacterium]|nr:extracellular solute-binding protein [Chloroflexota bacterium]